MTELEARLGSHSLREFNRAAKDWSNCLTSEAPGSLNSSVCSAWEENGLEFRLNRIDANDWASVPSIESLVAGSIEADKVVIHLSGGTDLPPFAYAADYRSDAFSYFHSRGYLFASIGYWGSRFRTNLQENEIDLAARDLRNALSYYRQRCACEPLVIGESLGAAIVFHYMRTYKDLNLDFLAISPVMLGISYAVSHFKTIRSSEELSREFATAYIYRSPDSEPEQFVGTRLIQPIRHLEAFAVERDTTPLDEMLNSQCPSFIIGENDPQNSGFDQWDLASIVAIENAGHDVFSGNTGKLHSVFETAIECISTSVRNELESNR